MIGNADMYSADLNGSNLKRGYMYKTNLRGANLSGADLRFENLCETNLSGADLRNANLSGADLRNANFSGADLRNANFSRADLGGADLQSPKLSSSDVIGTDLRGANMSKDNISEYGIYKIINDSSIIKYGSITMPTGEHPSRVVLRRPEDNYYKYSVARENMKINGDIIHHMNFHSSYLFNDLETATKKFNNYDT